MIGYTNMNRLEKRQQFLKEFIEKETAKKNHLKYMVFWNQDLSDFYQWVKKGCQIKNSY